MGKAKTRILKRGEHEQMPTMTREGAIKETVRRFKNKESVYDIVTLFGLTAEELLEGGALYEEVKSIEGILNAQ